MNIKTGVHVKTNLFIHLHDVRGVVDWLLLFGWFGVLK